jgi:signal transduction histidine kinase
MRSLFVKIFIWFWVASMLVTVAHMVSTMLLGPEGRGARFIANRVSIYGATAAEKVSLQGKDAAADYLNMVEGTTNIRCFLFDQQGGQVVGREAPNEAKALATTPASPRRRFFRLPRLPEFIRTNVSGPDGTGYVLVADMRRERGMRFLFEPRIRWRELIAGLLTAGVLCYWLARHLSAPVVKLREATQKLAAGDLTARVGVAKDKRGDELVEMGRDFDNMADRIETLMLSQRRLLHDISHELRSPLARLGVALELARQGDPTETAWALDRIELEAERLNEMVSQVLTLARLENGAQEKHVVPVDLAGLVNEIAQDADFEAGSRNRAVRVVASQDCKTSGNPELLRSAIENVVRNAVLYTREGTDVEISLYHSDGERPEAVIVVRDRGAGVPELALLDIFRPFYRVADARDRESGATGLGLSITQRAVQLHGGTVKASNAPEGGLTVEIRLPIIN